MSARRSRAGAVEEPVGIIISYGPRTEPVPRFCAYEWGPPPDADAGTAEPKAAA